MIRLMKLELRKVSLKRYVLFSLIGILMTMFFIFAGLQDTSTTIYDYEVTFRMIGLIFCFYYIILFSVSVVAYIISEYTHKTILVMFAYPVDRRKLILAKLILITVLVMLAMVIGYVCCSLFIVLVDRYCNLVIGDFHVSLLSQWVQSAVKGIIMFCSLGMWTFVVGMMKKSIPMTIISAVVLCYVRQFILAGTDLHEEGWLLVLAAAAAAIGGVYYTLTHKVND